VEQLAEEYARAGADITQTFTFYNRDVGTPEGCCLTCLEINQASCKIAKKISRKRGTVVAAGIIQTAVYKRVKGTPEGKEEVHKELTEGLEVLIQNNVDAIFCEYFHCIEEMEWAIELALSYGKTVAATMCMGPTGDGAGVSPGECAVRMAKAGAPIIGINCLFDPFICLETVRMMKEALDAEGLTPFLMAQPLGFRTPDAGRYGWITLPEFPFAMEPRMITRWEAARFAREAYELGVRVIGGCCGFEPYHIRAMAEELAEEKGGLPEGSDKSDHDLSTLKKKADLGRPDFALKGSKQFWRDLVPCTGRPMSSALFRQPDPQLVNKAILK
jgi:betaine-homocysteine S-methyltransferase